MPPSSEPLGRPAIGESLHYVAWGTPIREDGTQAFPSVCRAATVTEVQTPSSVALFVMNPTGVFFHPAVDWDEERAPGTWHWPHV